MHICFVDEAGDLGALGNPPQPNDQPVLAIGGLFVDAANLASLTDNFLTLKHLYFPGLPYPSARHLDRILPEVKGAEIRGNATRGSARQRTHAIGFLDRILGLLRHNDVRMVARIWVKGIGSRFDATSVYTSSIQGICGYFEHYLTQNDTAGVCIAYVADVTMLRRGGVPVPDRRTGRSSATYSSDSLPFAMVLSPTTRRHDHVRGTLHPSRSHSEALRHAAVGG